jgi:hypothetical protein
MHKEPTPGVNRSPSVLAWHVLEEAKRSAFSVPEQKKPKTVGEALVQPLNFTLEPLILPIHETADPALGEVCGANLL